MLSIETFEKICIYFVSNSQISRRLESGSAYMKIHCIRRGRKNNVFIFVDF